MDGGQILLSYIKVWVILLLLSATFQNSKLAAKNSTAQDKKRKLAEENPVDAIMAIKKAYKIDRVDWQGDPCLPLTTWSGLQCNDDNPPRIISLNLSSSQLSGNIAISLLNLTAIKSLDLSNNELTGTMPEAFTQLPYLTILDLRGNKLTGAVPHSLKEKSNNGQLQLSLDGNPDLCKMDTCEKKKGSFPVPVIASVIPVSVLLLLSIITIFWRLKRGRLNVSLSSSVGLSLSLKSKNQPFTYIEIVSITNNFQTIIGEGGFGKVYLGNLKNGRQVAVKLLSQSSRK
ncbi:hypothetical protein Peur_062963 [Populus x canadensis]